MNLPNIKQKLDKVNRFYTYLEANQEVLSNIDRDALLAAIRELYDACFEDAASTPTVAVEEKTAPKTTTKETKTTSKRPKLVFNTPTKTEKEVPAPKEEVAPKVAPKEEPTPEPTPTVEAPAPKEEPIIKQEPVVPAPPKATTPEPAKEEAPTPSNDFNEDYEELFMFKVATDLSQKLSEAPIKDLNKALGLNEKFLYINELFNGDVAKFQASVKLFNEAGGFDAARTHIEKDLIETYNWTNKLKKTVAKDFIKLVRRRYL